VNKVGLVDLQGKCIVMYNLTRSPESVLMLCIIGSPWQHVIGCWCWWWWWWWRHLL